MNTNHQPQRPGWLNPTVIGALCISVLLSLVATPAVYYLMLRLREKPALQPLAPQE